MDDVLASVPEPCPNLAHGWGRLGRKTFIRNMHFSLKLRIVG